MDEQAVLKANGLVEAFLKTARRPLVVLLGPTASGKTQLSLDLASLFDGEIISADSRQVYRHMDVGTDKVPLDKRKIVPHHMIDIVDPDERFTTADYKKMTEKTIDEVLAKKRIPFLVGGTGLYLRTITQNFSLAGESQNLEIRKKLEEELTYIRFLLQYKVKNRFVLETKPVALLTALVVLTDYLLSIQDGDHFSNPLLIHFRSLTLKSPIQNKDCLFSTPLWCHTNYNSRCSL